LITSAPKSPRSCVQNGLATKCPSSMTRSPWSGPAVDVWLTRLPRFYGNRSSRVRMVPISNETGSKANKSQLESGKTLRLPSGAGDAGMLAIVRSPRHPAAQSLPDLLDDQWSVQRSWISYCPTSPRAILSSRPRSSSGAKSTSWGHAHKICLRPMPA
jgi:hypothetical protein